MAKSSQSPEQVVVDNEQLRKLVLEFMQERKAIFGIDGPNAAAYVKDKLELTCGKSKILRVLSSLVHKHELRRIDVDPLRGLSDSYGDRRVLFCLPGASEDDFPQEYQDFVSETRAERVTA